MIEAGRCRPVINKDVNRIKRMFRWAVEHELVPGGGLPGIADGRRAPQGAVGGAGARAGRAGARGARPGGPAVRHGPGRRDDPVAAADRGPAGRDHGACGRATSTRGTDGVWVYRPREHKTEHLDRDPGRS